MKTVFFDVDTQLDFLFPAGALYVPGAEKIAPALSDLTAFAKKNDILTISTIDSHAENDPEFQTWKPHCILGTQGQQKYAGTLKNSGSAGQVVIPKCSIDVFASKEIRKVVRETSADRYVVYGVVTEYCVQSVAFALLNQRVRVDLVVDAVKSLSESDGKRVLSKFAAQGGNLVTRSSITG